MSSNSTSKYFTRLTKSTLGPLQNALRKGTRTTVMDSKHHKVCIRRASTRMDQESNERMQILSRTKQKREVFPKNVTISHSETPNLSDPRILNEIISVESVEGALVQSKKRRRHTKVEVESEILQIHSGTQRSDTQSSSCATTDKNVVMFTKLVSGVPKKCLTSEAVTDDFSGIPLKHDTVQVNLNSVQIEKVPAKTGGSYSNSHNYSDSIGSSHAAVWQPLLWQEQLANIMEMRKSRDAPVDTMGCSVISDTTAQPQVRS